MKKKLTPLTVRSVIIGLICMAALCSITAYNDYYVGGTFLAGNHFPIGAAFLFTILIVVINVALKKVWSTHELSPAELLTIWCMMIVVASFPSAGLARYFFPTLVGLSYFATPENEWNEILHPYIPDWLIPRGSSVINDFYEGLSLGEPISWKAWIKPTLFWTSFIFSIWLVMICISVILRKQWVEREKMTFPLVQLSVEMVKRPDNSSLLNQFFRNNAMWIGFAIPVFLHTLGGLHFYFPKVPRIPLRFNLDYLFYERPWNVMRPMWLYIFLSVVGFTYLLNLEVSLSLWLFVILYKFQLVLGKVMGFRMPMSHGYMSRSFASHREMGAFIVLVGFFIWTGRSHIKDVFKKAVSKRYEVDDSNEPLSYRFAVVGLFGGVFISSLMLTAAGVSFLLAFGVILFYGVVCIVLTWLVVQGGLLFIHGSFRSPDLFYTIFGSSRLGHTNMTILAFPGRMIFRDNREFLMPHIMNSFKMSDSVSLNRRHLLSVMILTILLAIPITYYFHLRLIYTKGASNLQWWTFMVSPQDPFRRVASFFRNPVETNWRELIFIPVGSVTMLFLLFMRRRFFWWPIHPIGYVAAPGEWPMQNIWFSIFIGWLAKFAILKYGGLKSYRQAGPVFLGLVLGECFIGGIWAIVGLLLGEGYNMLPT